MKRTIVRLVPAAALVLLAVAGAALVPQNASSNAPIANKILAHKLAVELGREQARPWEMPVSSGVMDVVLEQTGLAPWQHASGNGTNDDGDGGNVLSRPRTEGCQNKFHGHGQTNTRVNQDCSFRRQAEEVVAINPLDDSNIIAGQNDS